MPSHHTQFMFFFAAYFCLLIVNRYVIAAWPYVGAAMSFMRYFPPSIA